MLSTVKLPFCRAVVLLFLLSVPLYGSLRETGGMGRNPFNGIVVGVLMRILKMNIYAVNNPSIKRSTSPKSLVKNYGNVPVHHESVTHPLVPSLSERGDNSLRALLFPLS
jgi:hypothetical protein